MKHTEGKNMLSWRVNIAALLDEILNSNDLMGIFKIPFSILGKMLALAGKRAAEINDPELNKLMMRLSIYAEGDAYDKHYNQKKYDAVMDIDNDKYPNVRNLAPELLEALKGVVFRYDQKSIDIADAVIKKATE